jgi:hypothetical protein
LIDFLKDKEQFNYAIDNKLEEAMKELINTNSDYGCAAVVNLLYGSNFKCTGIKKMIGYTLMKIKFGN